MELEPGETLTSEPAIGDSVRWELLPGTSGKGTALQSLTMVKPYVSGLDTNLVLTTDKPTYYLRLISREMAYIARIQRRAKQRERVEGYGAYRLQLCCEYKSCLNGYILNSRSKDRRPHER